ncbi:MAG: hypothetical protein ACE5EM_12395 [Sphingomonadales bacterium]
MRGKIKSAIGVAAMLVGLAGALGLVVAWQAMADASAWDPGHGGSAPQLHPETTSVGLAKAAPRISHFAAIVSRPLFNPSRRPAPRVEKKPEPAPQADRSATSGSIDRFVLVGVILSESGRSAMFRNQDTGQSHKVREREFIEGWQLGAITEDKVMLQRHGVTKIIDFAKSNRSPITGGRGKNARGRRR